MKRLSLALAFLFSLFFFFSCQKETETNTETVESVIEADLAIDDGLSAANSTADETKLLEDTATCYTVERSLDFQTRTGTVIITYNGEACADDGIYRDGKITIVFPFGWRLGLTDRPMTITYEDFTRKDKTFNGTLEVYFSYKQDSATGDTLPTFTTNSDLIITFNDGTSTQFNATKTIEYLSGFETHFYRADDILRINGNATGKNREGIGFTSISENLIIKKSCNFILPVSGTKTITLDDGTTYFVDFGDGQCDNVYTVTVNGETQTYTFGENE